MFPLGHLTVACGALWVSSRIRKQSDEPESAPAIESSNIAQDIDYRLVMFGALLPDLIDKPIGWIIFRDHFDANGHLYGHTLLAASTVLLPGLVLLVRRRDPRLFAMGVAILSHFLVDPVNHSPKTLLWPLLGTDFPHVVFLGTKLTVLSELVGGISILAVARWLWRRGRFWTFVYEGRL